MRVFVAICSLFFVLCSLGCGRSSSKENVSAVIEAEPELLIPADADAPSIETQRRKQAARIAASMDDKTLAAQIIMTGVDGNVSLGTGMKSILADVPAGGVMLFRYNLNSGKDAARLFLEECSSCIASVSGIAPFLAVDHEGGLVNRFGEGVGRLPPAAFYWEAAQNIGREEALRAIETESFVSGSEIRELGITMNLAPVAETLTAENILFMETRSYGPDAGFVRDAASAFIRGMDAAGIACTVKHFPGNSGIDPHLAAARIDSGKAALDLLVEPFAGIIRDQMPPALMVSHALVPALDGQNIASLSPRILKGWIRDELGFQGIIITDDFSMESASAQGLDQPEAVVRALAAGADMVIVWQPQTRATHRAIIAALEEGRLSRQRLREAVTRVLAEKIRYGIINEQGIGSRE